MPSYRTIYTFLNFALFQIAWALAVFLQNKALFALVLIAYLSWRLSFSKWVDLKIISACSIIGILIDNTLYWTGIFQFSTPYIIPAWLILLWLNFSLTLNHSLRWMTKIPRLAAALLGGLFGALSYYLGFRFGAVEFPLQTVPTLTLLVVLWASLMTVFLEIVKRVNAAK